ncbi:MAG: glutamate-1-semialdehyde 2,1-aminomutase [Methanoculleaceae archaeon]
MKSSELFSKARTMMPGGVSSPVRAIDPYPFYTVRAEGSRLYTVDDNEYIDCCMGYGPLILGHAHPAVQDVLRDQIEKGWLYGTPTPPELELASWIIGDHPSIEMVRFVNSGSEATMAAIRLARGFTGRNDIVKVEGGFHGAHDAVLVRAGSGAVTMGLPDSPGIPADVTAHTRQIPFNDPVALEECLRKWGEDIAAVIIEPVMGNVGLILPENGYLDEVRTITEDHDVLLIFDEVITGYRVGIGGAQKRFGITPDLTALGKIIGGGLPIGAVGGRREIMEEMAPAGPVYQAGTFSGNPLSLAAGNAAIRYLHDHPDIYRRMEEGTRLLEETIGDKGSGCFVRSGSMFTYFFRPTPPREYTGAKESDTEAHRRYWRNMLSHGVFLPPSQFETCFLSAAHTPDDIEQIAGSMVSCL